MLPPNSCCDSVKFCGRSPKFRRSTLPPSSCCDAAYCFVGYRCFRDPCFNPPWRWRQHGPLKRWYPPTTLHVFTIRKTSTLNISFHQFTPFRNTLYFWTAADHQRESFHWTMRPLTFQFKPWCYLNDRIGAVIRILLDKQKHGQWIGCFIPIHTPTLIQC
jgi:hypothetical protein